MPKTGGFNNDWWFLGSIFHPFGMTYVYAVFNTYRTKYNFKFLPTSHKICILLTLYLILTNKLKKKKLKKLCYCSVVISSYCPFMGSLQQEVIFNGTTKLLCNCNVQCTCISPEKKYGKDFDGGWWWTNHPEALFFFFFWRAEALFWKGTIKKISCGNADALWNKKITKKLWRTTHTSVMRVFSTSAIVASWNR